MLISGVPLLIRVEQTDHTFSTYTTVAAIPDAPTRTKVQAIIDSPIKVSKITIKLS
jgi:hypothetical protein